jgi:hypothetical protein
MRDQTQIAMRPRLIQRVEATILITLGLGMRKRRVFRVRRFLAADGTTIRGSVALPVAAIRRIFGCLRSLLRLPIPIDLKRGFQFIGHLSPL